MIEAMAIPLFTKAIHFLFDESHKILEERRERKRLNQQTASTITEPFDALEIPSTTATSLIQTREEILRQKIDQSAWLQHERDVEHLLSLIDIYSRNYRLAKEQYAKWGDALVPAIIVHNLEEAEQSMLDSARKLELILNKVSEKPIVIPELNEDVLH